jgi:hypothetical protein
VCCDLMKFTVGPCQAAGHGMATARPCPGCSTVLRLIDRATGLLATDRVIGPGPSRRWCRSGHHISSAACHIRCGANHMWCEASVRELMACTKCVLGTGTARLVPPTERSGSGFGLFGHLLFLAPADAGFDESVDLTVEDGRGVVDLVAGAQVLDHLVRVRDV